MEYKTVIVDLPTTIPGFAKYDPVSDFATIVLNARMCYCKNRQTYLHELKKHIEKGDFDCREDVDTLETLAHERGMT